MADLSKWSDLESRLDFTSDIILSILEEERVHATFFVLGWVAEKYPKLIQKIASFGHHVGSHSYAHQLVHKMTEVEFKEDLKKL